MDDLFKKAEIPAFFHHLYAERLKDIGFEKEAFVKEDISSEDLHEIMKPGHRKRFMRALRSNSRKSDDRPGDPNRKLDGNAQHWDVEAVKRWAAEVLSSNHDSNVARLTNMIDSRSVNGQKLLGIASFDDLDHCGIDLISPSTALFDSIVDLRTKTSSVREINTTIGSHLESLEDCTNSDEPVGSKRGCCGPGDPRHLRITPAQPAGKQDCPDIDEDISRFFEEHFSPPEVVTIKRCEDSSAVDSTPAFPLSIRLPMYTREATIMLGPIGRTDGSESRVYKGLYAPTLTFVAVKVLPSSSLAMSKHLIYSELKVLYLLSKQSGLREQTRESETEGEEGLHSIFRQSASLSDYIVTFYDAYLDPSRGGVCVVMEYMDQGSLRNMVKNGYIFDEDSTAIVAYSVLRGLEMLHDRRILHRDIKPENILCSGDGKIKIADFGLVSDLSMVSGAKTFTGTLNYMSPERIRGEPYGFPGDIWSLGMCLISIVTRKNPLPVKKGFWHFLNALLKGKFLHLRDNSAYSAELIDFVDNCVNLEPTDRPTVKQLLEHPFISKAKERKVILPTSRPLLVHLPPEDTMPEEGFEQLLLQLAKWRVDNENRNPSGKHNPSSSTSNVDRFWDRSDLDRFSSKLKLNPHDMILKMAKALDSNRLGADSCSAQLTPHVVAAPESRAASELSFDMAIECSLNLANDAIAELSSVTLEGANVMAHLVESPNLEVVGVMANMAKYASLAFSAIRRVLASITERYPFSEGANVAVRRLQYCSNQFDVVSHDLMLEVIRNNRNKLQGDLKNGGEIETNSPFSPSPQEFDDLSVDESKSNSLFPNDSMKITSSEENALDDAITKKISSDRENASGPSNLDEPSVYSVSAPPRFFLQSIRSVFSGNPLHRVKSEGTLSSGVFATENIKFLDSCGSKDGICSSTVPTVMDRDGSESNFCNSPTDFDGPPSLLTPSQQDEGPNKCSDVCSDLKTNGDVVIQSAHGLQKWIDWLQKTQPHGVCVEETHWENENFPDTSPSNSK